MSDEKKVPSVKEFLKRRPMTPDQKRMNSDLKLVNELRQDPKAGKFSLTKELVRNMGRKRLAKKRIKIK